MSFTEEDYRQFMNVIHFLNLNKNFKMNLKNSLEATMKILKPPKKLLDTKRRAYNSSYVKAYNSYRLPTKGLYKDLDRIWDEIESDLGLDLIYMGTGVTYPFRQHALKTKSIWKQYLDQAYKLAERRAKKEM